MTYTWTVKNKEYDLKLTTRAIVEFEQKIGLNPIMIFGLNGKNIPTMEVMAKLIQVSTRHKYTMTIEEVYDLIDQYLEEGHALEDLVMIIVELYKTAGLISKDTDLKNALREKKNSLLN